MWIDIEDAIEVIKDDKEYKAITIGNTQGYYMGEQIKRSHFAFDKVFICLDLSKDISDCKRSIDRMGKTLNILRHDNYLSTNN